MHWSPWRRNVNAVFGVPSVRWLANIFYRTSGTCTAFRRCASERACSNSHGHRNVCRTHRTSTVSRRYASAGAASACSIARNFYRINHICTASPWCAPANGAYNIHLGKRFCHNTRTCICTRRCAFSCAWPMCCCAKNPYGILGTNTVWAPFAERLNWRQPHETLASLSSTNGHVCWAHAVV